MGVEVELQTIGSGFNRFTINTNFTAIQEAMGDALSRSGDTPNEMNADIDMNSNDLLNVGSVNTERLLVNGEEFVPSSVTAKGDPGDAATVEVGTVTTGDAGTDVIITNVGTESTVVLDFTIPKGDTGASGPGTGDMVAAQNLNDVANKATAFANIKQAATETATGVVELATVVEAAAGTDTTRAVTPAGVAAAIDDVGVILVDSGSISAGSFFTLDFASSSDYRHFRLVIDELGGTLSSAQLQMRVGAGGVDSGGSDYGYNRRSGFSSSDSTSYLNNSGNDSVGLSASNTGTSVNVDINIINPFSTTSFTFFNGTTQGIYISSILTHSQFWGARLSNKAISRISLFWDSGTITGGTYRLYGWK